jgi:hypothetical protein
VNNTPSEQQLQQQQQQPIVSINSNRQSQIIQPQPPSSQQQQGKFVTYQQVKPVIATNADSSNLYNTNNPSLKVTSNKSSPSASITIIPAPTATTSSNKTANSTPDVATAAPSNAVNSGFQPYAMSSVANNNKPVNNIVVINTDKKGNSTAK